MIVSASLLPDHPLVMLASPCGLSPLSLSFQHSSNHPSFLTFETGFPVDIIFRAHCVEINTSFTGSFVSSPWISYPCPPLTSPWNDSSKHALQASCALSCPQKSHGLGLQRELHSEGTEFGAHRDQEHVWCTSVHSGKTFYA